MDSETQKQKFTIQSINLWIYENFKNILIVAGILLLTLITAGVILEWQKKREKLLYSDLYEMQKKLQIAGEKVNGKNYRKQSGDLSSFLSKKEKKKSLIYSEDMKSLAQKYEKKIQINKGRKASAASAIDLANFFYLNNEKERAISLLSLFAFPKKKSSIYHLVAFQLATYYMDENNCEKALTVLKSLIANKKAISFHADSYFQSALCYEEMKNYKEAKNLYTKLIKDQNSEFDKQKFQEYIHLLTLKQKLEK